MLPRWPFYRSPPHRKSWDCSSFGQCQLRTRSIGDTSRAHWQQRRRTPLHRCWMDYCLFVCQGTNCRLFASSDFQEGKNNDKFYTHPRDPKALTAYLFAHNHLFYMLELGTGLLLLLLSLCEAPAVPFLRLDIYVHATLELLTLALVVFELGIKMRWLGCWTFLRHRRTMLKKLRHKLSMHVYENQNVALHRVALNSDFLLTPWNTGAVLQVTNCRKPKEAAEVEMNTAPGTT
ncbi:unnamed protein product [Ranitomeya imitator]|uniref:Uncharacterized protein n=1 Tax=Ranitomeya imitator TaxID=111125 RepID=A0ABN9L1C8_9NEOB|nr:unnamed protein product [Ranitomeya imitator]